jgi:glutaredoxin
MSIKVYTQPICSYCNSAKKLLESLGLEYEAIQVEVIGIEEFHKQVGKPVRTVPQIMIDDVLIGGFNELKEHFVNEGKINFKGDLV